MKENTKEIFLILRAQSGDKDAYNELLKSIQSSLYWYIWNMLSDKTSAEDVLQEVFVKIFRKLHQLKVPELFRPWAYRITTREVFKHIKRNSASFEIATEKDLLENYSDHEQADNYEEKLSEQLAGIVHTLSPSSKAVILLHYKEGLSLQEVADSLDISLGTAKSRLAYGLRVLRDKVEKEKL